VKLQQIQEMKYLVRAIAEFNSLGKLSGDDEA
jgi:hypothetical protein